MAFVGRGVPDNSFDEVQINNLREKNLLELPTYIFRVACDSLDSYSKWREVVSMADDDSRYALSFLEVEKCASAIHYDLYASPTESLLKSWGSRGMKAKTLAEYLNKLQIERPLKYLSLIHI